MAKWNGPLSKETQLARPWNCRAGIEGCTRDDKCASCRGRANRAAGRRKQNAARKALNVPDTRFHGQIDAEEKWRGPLRYEIKSGKQVESLAARFLAAERQADAQKAQGDARRFAFVAMPLGWGSDGVIAVRISTWREQIEPWLPGEAL